MFQYTISLLVLLILILTGTVLAFKTDFEALKRPFFESLESYDPLSSNNLDEELVEAWDLFQQDVNFAVFCIILVLKLRVLVQMLRS